MKQKKKETLTASNRFAVSMYFLSGHPRNFKFKPKIPTIWPVFPDYLCVSFDSVMKLKIDPATLFDKKKGARIGSSFFKVKWEVLPVKLVVLLKRNFLYETFSRKFLKSLSFEGLWVASCERLYNKTTLSKVNKESWHLLVPTEYLLSKNTETILRGCSTK